MESLETSTIHQKMEAEWRSGRSPSRAAAQLVANYEEGRISEERGKEENWSGEVEHAVSVGRLMVPLIGSCAGSSGLFPSMVTKLSRELFGDFLFLRFFFLFCLFSVLGDIHSAPCFFLCAALNLEAWRQRSSTVTNMTIITTKAPSNITSDRVNSEQTLVVSTHNSVFEFSIHACVTVYGKHLCDYGSRDGGERDELERRVGGGIDDYGGVVVNVNDIDGHLGSRGTRGPATVHGPDIESVGALLLPVK
ncbi:hypothetical protein EYF80_027425 [Liparis tanakae]|uniref:Uncharacterized protein n=1 Tax=Liparis tanakae TaxID=230148 RepID=A0A4Z2HAS7_9TELE|nr:hypothetical protein EYF80_027425 [Liparis tanakae]